MSDGSTAGTRQVTVLELGDDRVDVLTTDAAKTRYCYEFDRDGDCLSLKKRLYKQDRIPSWGPKTPHRVTDTVKQVIEDKGFKICSPSGKCGYRDCPKMAVQHYVNEQGHEYNRCDDHRVAENMAPPF